MSDSTTQTQAFCYDCVPVPPKKSKQVTDYRAAGDAEQCYGCRFYQWGQCSLVEGTIEAEMVCDLWEGPIQTYPQADYGMVYAELSHVAGHGAAWRLFIDSPITAAEPPKQVPLLPKPGKYEHPSYGVLEITAEKIANFVANVNLGIYQKQIPIDAEHELKLSGAVGYFSEAVVNADGSADAIVEWTDRGKSLIEADAYKYVSPEWYEAWTDPTPNGKTYQDVVIGLALTNHPFFKDKALRPLVASEGQLFAPPAETKGARAHVKNQALIALTDVSGKETPMTEKNEAAKATEDTKKFSELEGKVETLTKQFTEAQTARETAEASVKQFAEKVAALEADKQDREFRDLVKTFSMPADEAHHLDMLKALPDEKHEAYAAKEKAQTAIVKSRLFREVGSDSNAPGDGSAEAAIDAKAKSLMASDGITYAEGYLKAFNDPDLKHRLAVERTGGN